MKTASLHSAVLAAGTSSRFGSPKQLARFRGRSLVGHAVDLASQVTPGRSLLVVGAESARVLAACDPLPAFFCVNADYAEGMASSIRCAVTASEPEADGLLLLLADQPLITVEHLHELRTRWQQNPAHIVATAYAGIAAPPIIFPSSRFRDLKRLRGDQGARQLLRDAQPPPLTVPFDDAAVDIDRPADLELLH